MDRITSIFDLRVLPIVFAAFFSCFANASLPSCESFLSGELPITGFGPSSYEGPVRGEDFLVNVGPSNTPINVTRTGVSEIHFIDNESVGMGIHAEAVSIYKIPSDFTDSSIFDFRLIQHGNKIVLHLRKSGSWWKRDRNFTVVLDFTSGHLVAHEPVEQAKGEWHIASIIPRSESTLDGHFSSPQELRIIGELQQLLDRDANVERIGGFTVGNITTLLGFLTQGQMMYAYFIRDYDLPKDLTQMRDANELRALMAQSRAKITLAKVDLSKAELARVASVDLSGQIYHRYILVDPRVPMRFLLLKNKDDSGYRDNRSPFGDLRFWRVNFPTEAPWTELVLDGN